MQPTKAWSLVVVAVCSAVLAWLAARIGFANFPPLPWTAVPALLLLAFGEVLFARHLRMRLRGDLAGRPPGSRPGSRPGIKPVDPTAVPRVVALAKASSIAAAAFGGLAAGFGIYTLASLDKSIPKHDALVSAVTAVAAIALVGAALYLERVCRSPEPPDDDDDDNLRYPNGQYGHGS
jgi:drug/metabolite transporter (DMT)-like permease